MLKNFTLSRIFKFDNRQKSCGTSRNYAKKDVKTFSDFVETFRILV